MKAAIEWIKSIASEPEVGTIYDGKVVKVVDFGAFVNFFGAKDGLVHISQLAREKVAQVSDVVKEGQMVKVKLLGMDEAAIAADPPAVVQAARHHRFPHRLAAEQDGFERDQFGVFSEIGVERAVERALVEEDGFLGKPVE